MKQVDFDTFREVSKHKTLYDAVFAALMTPEGNTNASIFGTKVSPEKPPEKRERKKSTQLLSHIIKTNQLV
jgi:hypothetical protein